MQKYITPDFSWSCFPYTDTHEEFIQNYVVKGYFHEFVPEDVKEGFLTVEFIQAHSYFFWPLYDEAFLKAIKILEMALKQKASLLNIPLEVTNKKGEKRNKTFNALINEICNKPWQEYLKYYLHRARGIRNKQIHADTNQYSGIIGGKRRNIKLFINVLNSLFYDESVLEEQYKNFQLVTKQLKVFESKLLVLEKDRKKYLCYGVLSFKVINGTLFLACNPIEINAKESIEAHKYSIPHAVAMENFTFQNGELTGKSSDGRDIELYISEENENVQASIEYFKELSMTSEIDRKSYLSWLRDEALWELTNLEYEFNKSKYSEVE